MEYYDVSVVFN